MKVEEMSCFFPLKPEDAVHWDKQRDAELTWRVGSRYKGDTYWVKAQEHTKNVLLVSELD